MKKENGRYALYGNELSAGKSSAADRWQRFFVRKFHYDPAEQYTLSIHPNDYLGQVLGIKDILT